MSAVPFETENTSVNSESHLGRNLAIILAIVMIIIAAYGISNVDLTSNFGDETPQIKLPDGVSLPDNIEKQVIGHLETLNEMIKTLENMEELARESGDLELANDLRSIIETIKSGGVIDWKLLEKIRRKKAELESIPNEERTEQEDNLIYLVDRLSQFIYSYELVMEAIGDLIRKANEMQDTDIDFEQLTKDALASLGLTDYELEYLLAQGELSGKLPAFLSNYTQAKQLKSLSV